MFLRSLIAVGLSALVTNANIASAATTEDVQKLAAMVMDESVPALFRQTYHLSSGEVNGYQAVFVCNGMRYTLYNSGERIKADDPESAWLAFWVRKDGTTGQQTLDTFSDDGFDGTADFGIDGLRQKEYIPDGIPATTSEHQPFWQQQLDDAVSTLLNCIR
jgi:hypothetical protein